MSESRPFYFGPEDAPVFGILTPPPNEGDGPAVLIVPPLGFENVGSYRPLRTLSQRLAADGCTVLRFDWPGCGDSADAPSSTNGDGIGRWTHTVASAAGALREHTGASEVLLVGLRIGATLALVAAAEGGLPVTEIALLAPYVTGQTYLRELRAYHALTEGPVRAGAIGPPLPDGWVESSGFAFSPDEAAVLGSVDVRKLDLSETQIRSALVVPSPAAQQTPALVQLLSDADIETAVEFLPGIVHSYDDPARSALTRSFADAVDAWVGSRPRTGHRGTPMEGENPASAAISTEGATLHEQSVALGEPGHRVLGVTCEPAGANDPDRPWIVFLNAGAVRRSGPNRLWTMYARHWAAAGVPSLRVDVRGVGDSDGDVAIDGTPGEHYDVLYSVEALADVRTALRWLRESRGARRYHCIGLCSGGFLGFHAALAETGVASVTLVNPQTLYWDPGDSSLRALDYVRVALRRPKTWVRVFSRRGARLTVKALRGLGNTVLRRGGLTGASSTGDRILAALDDLHAAGTAVQFVFAAENLGLAYLKRHLGAGFREVIESHNVTVTVVPGPDHTFTPLWSHDVLRGVLERHLTACGVELAPVRARD